MITYFEDKNKGFFSPQLKLQFSKLGPNELRYLNSFLDVVLIDFKLNLLGINICLGAAVAQSV
jgi:hypothetical protein